MRLVTPPLPLCAGEHPRLVVLSGHGSARSTVDYSSLLLLFCVELCICPGVKTFTDIAFHVSTPEKQAVTQQPVLLAVSNAE